VVLFARTSKALSRLNDMLRKGEIKKIYWAVVKNKPFKYNDHLIHYLRRNEEKNKSFAYDLPKPGTQRAELNYELIGTGDRYYFLEVELLTGRHHQIRAQLAAIGCPIKGDIKYGYPRTNDDGSIHLHAREMSFVHPVRKEMIRIVAEPPEDILWKAFRNPSSPSALPS
jgi:23S rRNA pseudouridine1911/1915/1917 synthase